MTDKLAFDVGLQEDAIGAGLEREGGDGETAGRGRGACGAGVGGRGSHSNALEIGAQGTRGSAWGTPG